MSSILNSSQGVVLATAMAVSGTVILLAFRLQKSFPPTQFPLDPIPHSPPRSCISLDGKKRGEKKKKKKKKRVHFAEDVVDPIGNGEEFRRQHSSSNRESNGRCSNSSPPSKERETGRGERGMPANRVALYNGILRDRVVHHRLAYSY